MLHKVGTDIKIVYYIHSEKFWILSRYRYCNNGKYNFANCEECRTVRKNERSCGGTSFLNRLMSRPIRLSKLSPSLSKVPRLILFNRMANALNVSLGDLIG